MGKPKTLASLVPPMNNSAIPNDNNGKNKSTMAEISMRSVGIQTFRGEDNWQSEWIRMKKRQKRCMGKVDQMVKLLSASVTVGATNRYKRYQFDNTEDNNLTKQGPNINDPNPNRKFLHQSNSNNKPLDSNYNQRFSNSNLTNSSQIVHEAGRNDSRCSDEGESILEKNLSFHSSEGRTTYTAETFNYSNLNSDGKTGRFSDGKTKFKLLKRA